MLTRSTTLRDKLRKLREQREESSEEEFSDTESSRVEEDTSLNTPEDAEEESLGTELKSKRTQPKRLSSLEESDLTPAKSEDAEATGEDHL